MDMTFNQIATVLNEINAQMTGATSNAAIDTSSFVTQAQTMLRAGYDPLVTAISQVLTKTIFSERPYRRKFGTLRTTPERFGNHTRKINIIDNPVKEDDRFKLVDGQSIDPWIVQKPKTIQTNLYGANVYERQLTIYKDQLDNAFRGPDEFGSFLDLTMTNLRNTVEQDHENTARATILNLIAAAYSQQRAVNVLALYNANTGESLTMADVFAADNFPSFARWLRGYVMTLSDALESRTALYHQNITATDINGSPVAGVINRHTPKDRQRLYLLSPLMNMIESTVYSTTFNELYAKFGSYEPVDYWQNPGHYNSQVTMLESAAINVKPSYINNKGLEQKAQNAVQIPYVVGVIMDIEAAGYVPVNQWSHNQGLNGRGGYSNLWLHYTDRYYNDLTENNIILYMADSN